MLEEKAKQMCAGGNWHGRLRNNIYYCYLCNSKNMLIHRKLTTTSTEPKQRLVRGEGGGGGGDWVASHPLLTHPNE